MHQFLIKTVLKLDWVQVIIQAKLQMHQLIHCVIFHFNESINLSHFASGAGNEILIDNDSAFGSVVACTLSKTGTHFGNQIIATCPSSAGSGTRFYVKANTGGQNEGGQAYLAHKNLDLLQLHHKENNGIKSNVGDKSNRGGNESFTIRSFSSVSKKNGSGSCKCN